MGTTTNSTAKNNIIRFIALDAVTGKEWSCEAEVYPEYDNNGSGDILTGHTATLLRAYDENGEHFLDFGSPLAEYLETKAVEAYHNPPAMPVVFPGEEQPKAAPALVEMISARGFMTVLGSLPAIITTDDRRRYNCRYIDSITPINGGSHSVAFRDASWSEVIQELNLLSAKMAA